MVERSKRPEIRRRLATADDVFPESNPRALAYGHLANAVKLLRRYHKARHSNRDADLAVARIVQTLLSPFDGSGPKSDRVGMKRIPLGELASTAERLERLALGTFASAPAPTASACIQILRAAYLSRRAPDRKKQFWALCESRELPEIDPSRVEDLCDAMQAPVRWTVVMPILKSVGARTDQETIRVMWSKELADMRRFVAEHGGSFLKKTRKNRPKRSKKQPKS